MVLGGKRGAELTGSAEGNETSSKRPRAAEAQGGAPAESGSRDSRMLLVTVLVLDRSGLGAEGLVRVCQLLYQTCRALRQELLERKFCCRTAALCSALSSGGDNHSHVALLSQNVARRQAACEDPAERGQLVDTHSFLQRATLWVTGIVPDLWLSKKESSVRKWVQSASQEPDASFLSRGARNVADVLGLHLLHWEHKPQERYAGLRTLCGHARGVNCVDVSPDGTRIVSGSDDGLVKVWDTATGKEVRTLQGRPGKVLSVGFSPDGKRILSGSGALAAEGYGLVEIWDAMTGGKLRTWRCGSSNSCIALGVRFSPDGTRVLGPSAEDVSVVEVWDAAGVKVLTLRGLAGLGEVFCAAFSPDGTRIVTGGDDTHVVLWGAATGVLVRVMVGHENAVYGVAFSPDARHIASVSSDHLVKIWEAATGAQVRTLKGHSNVVVCVCFSPDGKRVVSGGDDKLVTVWDVETGAQVRALRGHTEIVHSVRFSPDGLRIVSGSADGLVKIWDAAIGAEVSVLRGHSGKVHSVGISPDGKRVVSGANDGLVKISDPATGAEVLAMRGGIAAVVLCVGFSPDGKLVVSGSHHGMVQICDAATGAEVRAWAGHLAAVNSVGFSPDGRRVFSGSDDYLVTLWDVATGSEVWSCARHQCTGTCICSWSIDLYERHYVELDPECPVRGHSGEVFSAAFSPDGKRVVSGAWDGTVKILDAATGVEVRSIDAHVDYQVATVDFSPDGRRIVSGSPSENRVKIWDAESGEMLWSITGRKGAFVDCLPDPLKSSYHFLTARDEELLVFERSFQEEENERSFQEGEKAPVASFMAPGEVTCVEVRGSAILLGCMDGSVVLLRAPFLSA